MLKQDRAVRTRRSLVHSAAEAFERYGYAQARLTDISSSAGVSPGALHFHFENKAAVAATVEATAAESLRRSAWTAQPPGINPLQRLTNASHALADRLRRDVVARAGFRLSGDASYGPGLNLRKEWEGCVHRLLDEAAGQDLLAEGVDRPDMVATIVAATTGFEVLGRRNKEWLAPEAITSFWRLMLPCLASAEALRTLDPGLPQPGPDGTVPEQEQRP
ncbi:ScbR family autoregulator-binding transcription factor [Streptomyces sp. NPDC059009]|uniref:ScbR family autoregulator-binding transcription factor n=1 Tax=Streptomyces sp. NPDC059009 TaxID=3346694 RepID=UPI003699BC48